MRRDCFVREQNAIVLQGTVECCKRQQQRKGLDVAGQDGRSLALHGVALKTAPMRSRLITSVFLLAAAISSITT